MKHLYFVRHGLSEMNKQGIFSGRTETSLVQEGIDQAHKAGIKARDHGIQCIVSSPMHRAKDTAAIIAQEINLPSEDIIHNDLFIERGFGVLEGTTYIPDIDFDTIEGAEDTDAIIIRAEQGLAYLRSLPFDTILVVGHGAIGRALRHAIDPEIPFKGSEKFDNASITKLI
ncbi:histidine phosphatase family protein [Candidatus Saccharibacteria bacterium]|nr:histidine phosphatase family protein [Candidatus Saccharibacteria bacterium]